MMKERNMMKRMLAMAAVALAFVGCSDDNDVLIEPAVKTKTVTFEGAQLGNAGFVWGKELATEQDDVDYGGDPLKSNIYYGPIYTEQDAQWLTYFTDYGHTFDTWNGFVVSKHTDMKTEGYLNDKSVYASSGANGSKQFAVAYYSSYTADDKGIPTVKFNGAVKPVSVWVANTTYLYLYFKGSTPAKAVDVKAVITGFNGETETGKVSVVLADASGSVKSGWENIDLSSLGTVTSLTVTLETADYMCPNYVAIDDLTYEVGEAF